MKKRLLIAGGSGLIGSAMAKEANLQGWESTILSRHDGPGRIVWDPEKGTIDLKNNETFEAIINLAGASIASGRWTEKRKKEIYLSRIDSCHTIEKYVREGRLSAPFYLGVSGIGIYGDRGNEIVNEDTPVVNSDDWLIKTTIDWESGHEAIAKLGIRTVILRTGIVLSLDGGALKEIISTPGFGVLSYFGNGKQIWSWIHIHDLIRMIFFCMEDANAKDVYLASSPHPVSNKILTKTINHYLKSKRLVVGAPKLVIATILGETHRILFESCNASSEKIESEGFQFEFPSVDAAVKNLLKK
ncbi:MAG: TIGR01777 family oxidoreductase [Saprospiraceae bacterium]